MYEVLYHPQVKKDIKKLDHSLIKEVRAFHILRILENPKRGKALLKNLAGIYSYHFRWSGQAYRIAYTIDEDRRTIAVLMIGKREGFYEVLKRRL